MPGGLRINEARIPAITQAICDYMGEDTHALSAGVETIIGRRFVRTAASSADSRSANFRLTAFYSRNADRESALLRPTPVISRAILVRIPFASGLSAATSGTEDSYKIYAESFQSEAHLNSIVSDAQEIVDRALESAP
jgi:phosphoglucomutase